MPKSRTLSDLYVVGKELEINDGRGTPVKVWIQKMNPIDHEKALRTANGVRAKIITAKRLPDDSDDKLEYYADVYEACPDRESMIAFVVSEEVAKISAAREDEIAAEDEWAKEDYLQGLRDAWFGAGDGDSLQAFYLSADDDEKESPEYIEASRVFDELMRYRAQIDTMLEGETRHWTKEYEDWSDEKLLSKVLDRFIEVRADMSWLIEYRRLEVLYGVRDIKMHNVKYFQNKTQVEELPVEVFAALTGAYQTLNVEIIEGKD